MITVSGGSGIINNLFRYHAKMEAEQKGRLRKACLLVRRRSQQVVPVDTSNLKNSAFTDIKRVAGGLIGYVGYEAAYAVFVHENMQARHKPGKQAKYLQQPLQDAVREIREILANG